MFPDPDPMDAIAAFVFKGAISFGIIYAWTFGFNRPSKFRAGNARNMREDYASYPGNKAELSSMLAFRIFLSSGCQAGCDRPGPDHVCCGYGSPEKD